MCAIINLNVDYQFVKSKFSVNIYTKNTSTLRCHTYCNKSKFQPASNSSCLLAYTSQFESNSNPITINGTISTTENYIEFLLPDTLNNGSYFSQIVLTEDDKQFVFADGFINVKRTIEGF